MLLYHFPLTSDYSNRGYAKLYDANGNEKPLASLTTGFVSGGKISSNAKGTTTTLGTSYWDKRYNSYSIAIRAYRGNDANNIYGHLIVLHGGSTGKIDLNARFLNGNLKIGYYVTQSQVVITEIDVPATIGWHDIVMNFNSGTLKCYLDTNFIGSIDSISYDIVPYFFGNNFIGSNISTTTLIQDVRIYDRELSQAEINEYSRALVVHYPLQGNELNQSVLKDVSGFGNDYTLQGTNSYQLDSARGVKSLHTTDTAIYAQTQISSGYTTSFWCKYNGEWKHLCNNGSKYVNGVIEASLYDTIYATLTVSGYDIVDYRVYATALSAEDIKNLYNSPIAVSKQHQSLAFEFKENPLYPSKYWRTPTYAEMNYIINTRTNAANLRTLVTITLQNSTQLKGAFLLPDDWVAPDGVSLTITPNNYSVNVLSHSDYLKCLSAGAVFMRVNGYRSGSTYYDRTNQYYYGLFWVGNMSEFLFGWSTPFAIISQSATEYGFSVRLVRTDNTIHSFSVGNGNKIKFAKSNLKYHCTQHIWAFHDKPTDFIGYDNANISDSYNDWIDLFGYGTSGVNYSPTLHTTTNSDYASGDISNTDNDWGVNEIQSYDYNVKNFALNKNGILQHNELIEGSADGCYQDKLITNELKEQ